MLSEKNKLLWLFLFLLIIYTGLAFLYMRSEKRLERLEQKLQRVEEMQAQLQQRKQS